jgi:hypothetical protein
MQPPVKASRQLTGAWGEHAQRQRERADDQGDGRQVLDAEATGERHQQVVPEWRQIRIGAQRVDQHADVEREEHDDAHADDDAQRQEA